MWVFLEYVAWIIIAYAVVVGMAHCHLRDQVEWLEWHLAELKKIEDGEGK